MPVPNNATTEIEEIVRGVAQDLSDFLPATIDVNPFPPSGAQITFTPADPDYSPVTVTYFRDCGDVVIKANEGRVTEALAYRLEFALKTDHPDLARSVRIVGPQSTPKAKLLADLVGTVGEYGRES